eukprot:scaffold54553_cov30-Tisochrysis_lutea.AAC.5
MRTLKFAGMCGFRPSLSPLSSFSSRSADEPGESRSPISIGRFSPLSGLGGADEGARESNLTLSSGGDGTPPMPMLVNEECRCGSSNDGPGPTCVGTPDTLPRLREEAMQPIELGCTCRRSTAPPLPTGTPALVFPCGMSPTAPCPKGKRSEPIPAAEGAHAFAIVGETRPCDTPNPEAMGSDSCRPAASV